jgi:hypothetical protein
VVTVGLSALLFSVDASCFPRACIDPRVGVWIGLLLAFFYLTICRIIYIIFVNYSHRNAKRENGY